MKAYSDAGLTSLKPNKSDGGAVCVGLSSILWSWLTRWRGSCLWRQGVERCCSSGNLPST
eukprot:scaffold178740_cov13-Tisochrysis_lutea.AAC.1